MNTLKKHSTKIACGILALGVVFLGFGLKITFQKADAATTVFFNQGGTSTTSAQTQGIYFFNGTLGSFSQDTSANGLRWDFSNARLGVATTSPGTVFSIGGDAAGINFVANGTSTFNAGINVGTGGLQSSAGLTITGGVINLSSSGTSTFNNGINLTGGCFRVNGACIGAGGSGTVTSVGVSSSGTITIGSSPVTTSGTITADLNLASANVWTASTSWSNAASIAFGTTTSVFDGSRLKIFGQAYTAEASSTGATPTAIAIDWNSGNQQTKTLITAHTITFSGGLLGGAYRLILCQDGTGSRTVSSWPLAVNWNGSPPTLSTGAGKCDVISFLYTRATSTPKYFGVSALGF
jgi:hypothetical protein